MLPEALAAIHRERGNTQLADQYATEVAESQRLELELIREVALPGIPRVGEEVWANPNWEPVPVVRVEWMLGLDMDDESFVTVYLADLDEDEVGAEYGATELLLDSGWRSRLDL
ncbi:hypothetical protein [Pseudonocardia asaccharolytica]|nr:hypothetical protein [Pseudonocardia asaccharolytica]